MSNWGLGNIVMEFRLGYLMEVYDFSMHQMTYYYGRLFLFRSMSRPSRKQVTYRDCASVCDVALRACKEVGRTYCKFTCNMS